MKRIQFALWPTIAGAVGHVLVGQGGGMVAAIGTALDEDARWRFGTSR